MSREAHTAGPFTVEVPLSNAMRVVLEEGCDGRLVTLWNEAGDPIADADMPETVQLCGDVGGLREAVALAAETFHRYAQQHWAKGTAESRSKAIANAELSDRMRAALAYAAIQSATGEG